MKSSLLLLLHSHRNCIMPGAKAALVLLSALVAAIIIPTADGFSLSPSISATRHHHHVVGGGGASTLISPSLPRGLICKSNYHHQGGRRSTSLLFAVDPSNNNNNDDESSIIEQTSSTTMYTPFNRPLLATIDTIALIIFAAIGKSSHTTTGDIDIIAVLLTAFPFVTSWLLTSPITNVYSPDEDDTSDTSNILLSTSKKVGKGWGVAIPLGIVLRGVIKGYAPPVPFIIVTLISTFVILVLARVLFAIVEDVFVEIV